VVSERELACPPIQYMRSTMIAKKKAKKSTKYTAENIEVNGTG